MQDMPGFLNHNDWYVEKKLDDYEYVYELTSKAPAAAMNELRMFYANYYSDSHGKIVGEYTNKLTGETFVIDRKGRVLRKGPVDRNKYNIMVFY